MTSHSGLPIPGYKPQPAAAVAAVTRLKHLEERVLRELDLIARETGLEIDPRWLATGRTDIEKGFMSANRTIFRPGRITLPGDEATANA